MRSPTASTQGILDVGEVRPFELHRWPPAPDLAEYIERHWAVRWRLVPGESFTQELLPHPCVNLVSEADMLALHASCNVSDFARRHGVSVRTLQRRFREYVGVGPKWVLKRYRVHEAAERIASGEAPDAARLAADLGYFDQSHLIRDFTAQVGRSPGRYAELCAARDRPSSMHSASLEIATGIEGSAIPP